MSKKITVFAVENYSNGPFLWLPLKPQKWNTPYPDSFNQKIGYLTISGYIHLSTFKELQTNNWPRALTENTAPLRLTQGFDRSYTGAVESKLDRGFKVIGEIDPRRLSITATGFNQRSREINYTEEDLEWAFLNGFKSISLKTLLGLEDTSSSLIYQEPLWA